MKFRVIEERVLAERVTFRQKDLNPAVGNDRKTTTHRLEPRTRPYQYLITEGLEGWTIIAQFREPVDRWRDRVRARIRRWLIAHLEEDGDE